MRGGCYHLVSKLGLASNLYGRETSGPDTRRAPGHQRQRSGTQRQTCPCNFLRSQEQLMVTDIMACFDYSIHTLCQTRPSDYTRVAAGASAVLYNA